MHAFSTSKLAETLRLLNAEEFKALGQWLNSPWWNSNKSVLTFYKKIKGFYPGFDDPRCNKERLFKQMYPKKEFKAKLILTLMSELFKQAEKMLIQLQLEKDDHARGKLLEEAFLERNGMERYGLMVDQRMERLEAQKVLTQEDKLALYSYYEGMYHQASSNIRHQPTQQVLYKMNRYLDRFYALGKHRLLNEMTERAELMKGEESFSINTNSLALLREELKEPVLDLYILKKEVTRDINKSDYLILKSRFLEQVDVLELKDQKIIFMTLVNMAIRFKIRKTEGALKEILEWYQLGLKRDWLIHGGSMTGRTFSNIVTVANVVGDTNFSIDFINQYVASLKSSIREDAKVWALAHCAYYQGEFSLAVDHLRDYTFSDHIFNFQGRFVLLKSYFDIYLKDNSYYDYLNSYLLASEKFIRRDKLFSKTRIEGYLKLIRYIKKLTTLLYDDVNKVERLLELREELSADQNVQGEEWLMEKLETIEGRYTAG